MPPAKVVKLPYNERRSLSVRCNVASSGSELRMSDGQSIRIEPASN